MGNFIEIISNNLLSIISGLIITVAVVCRNKLANYIVTTSKKYIQSKFKTITEDAIKNFIRINEILLSIATRFNADMVHIIQFHNGQTFVSEQPIWKCSCTNEYVKPGIAPKMNSLENVQINMFMNVLQCLWGHPIEGIKHIMHNDCPRFKTCENAYKGLYEIDVENLPNCYFKSVNLLNGCRRIFLVPMVLNNNFIVGYLAIYFIGDVKKYVTDSNDFGQLCNDISTLQYAIAKSGYKYGDK